MTVVAQPFTIGRRCSPPSTRELCGQHLSRDKAAEACDQADHSPCRPGTFWNRTNLAANATTAREGSRAVAGDLLGLD